MAITLTDWLSLSAVQSPACPGIDAIQEAELLERCRAGDWSGYGILVERYQRLVWAAVDSAALDTAASADLQQEVFVRAFQKLHLYSGRSSFSSWLYRLARNVALNHLRQRARRPVSIPVDSLPEQAGSGAWQRPDRNYASQARGLLLRRLLSGLPPVQHEALARYSYLEQSYETIAAEMRLPLNTVRTQLRRARLRLQAGARAAGWELGVEDE